MAMVTMELIQDVVKYRPHSVEEMHLLDSRIFHQSLVVLAIRRTSEAFFKKGEPKLKGKVQEDAQKLGLHAKS
jgi:hypothetical protein